MLTVMMRNTLIACILACALFIGGCVSAEHGSSAREASDDTGVASAGASSQQFGSSEERDIAEGTEDGITTAQENGAKAVLNGESFSVELADNETAAAFESLLPLDAEMSELNGNEKYVYLDESIPSNPVNPGQIEVGDVMLYGSNCLVVFYESHPTTYSYTRIGKISDASELAETLGKGSITAAFSR